MKILATFILSLALFAGTAASAFATSHDHMCPSGREYGQHISMHARMGHFGPGMNPGMHWGYSGYCEHHDHGDL